MNVCLRIACAATVALLSASTARAGSELADTTEGGADHTGPTDVIIDYGSNPIPPEVFDSPDYVPPPGYLKNTPRTAQFNAEETLSSPGEPDGVVTIVTTPDGYTWKIIARTRSANWPYDPTQYPTLDPPPTSAWDAAFRAPTPPPGVVRYSANEKNQRMTFWANEGDSPTGAPILRYFTQDEWGNRYMMMASGGATVEETLADFTAAVLPDGWKKWLGYLPETVTVAPAYGADDQAQFNIWRDSGDNTHVQIHWSSSGHGIAEQIAGMPIWGGERSNLHYGTAGDDLIHGAGGDDTIVALGGDDTIHGDAGTDTVVLEGSSADYVDTSIYGHGSFHEFIGLGTTKLLYDVEFVRFADVTCSVKPSWRCPPRRILGPRQRLLPHG